MTETNKVKRQHLVNLHGSTAPSIDTLKGKDFKTGEIAVQNGTSASESALHITDGGLTEVVTFLPKGQDASYAKATNLTNLETRVATAEKEITDNAKVAAEGITTNKTSIESIRTNVATNTNAIGGLDARLVQAEGTITTHGTDIADLKSGTVTNVTLGTAGATTVEINKTVNGSSAQTLTLPAATKSTAGVMAAADKKKLDELKNVNEAATSITMTGDVSGDAVASGNKLTVSNMLIGDGKVTDAKIASGIAASKVSGKLTSATIASSKVEGNFTSERINALTGFADATSYKDVSATDSLNVALGKLSKGHKELSSAIAGGTHWIGVESTFPETSKNGDIISIKGHKTAKYNGKEYIWDDKQDSSAAPLYKWIELGDSTADQERITTLEGYFGTDKILDVAHGGTGASSLTDVTVGNAEKAYSKTIDQLSTYVLDKTSGSGDGDFIKSVSLSKGVLNATTGSFSGITAGKATDADYAAHIGTTASHPQIGGETKPVYVASDGTVTSFSSTVGAENKAVYLNQGTITAMSETYGGAKQPVYINQGTITPCDSYPIIPAITVSGNTATIGKVLTTVTPSNHDLAFTEQAVVYNNTPINFKEMTIDCGTYE